MKGSQLKFELLSREDKQKMRFFQIYPLWKSYSGAFLDNAGKLFFCNYLPGVSAASPRRILFGVRAFFTRVRAQKMHAHQKSFLRTTTC